MTNPVDPHVTGPLATAQEVPRRAVTVDASDLDRDLRARLTSVRDEELGGAERFQSIRPVIIESGLWLVLGVAIWALTILLWR
jgi:hypothetical protein